MANLRKEMKIPKHEFSDPVTYLNGKQVNLPEEWLMFRGHFTLPFSNKLHEGVYEIKFDYKKNDFTYQYYLN